MSLNPPDSYGHYKLLAGVSRNILISDFNLHIGRVPEGGACEGCVHFIRQHFVFVAVIFLMKFNLF